MLGHPPSSEVKNFGELKPVEPAARREGMPLIGEDQVYVVKYGMAYHSSWCQAVADKWRTAPRGLLVAMLAEVGARSPCQECAQLLKEAKPSPVQKYQTPQPHLTDWVVPLRVIGLAHGILFLAASPEHRGRLKETAVEPATPLYVGGQRDGMLVRLDAGRPEPLLVVQMDPRATFRNGPYQARLRHPLQRSATKPFAVACIEPVPEA
ncbi:hypothetical protein [Arthrobacter sp. CJ23]|uniref:hypothetical protein n=1 Tax=Arthrobacter sp. CJ23 TaxID=2972479 RepID=UPI00215C62E7|nr:hypothetical protein [Arthrobacter sp. CJ23]UVJ41341.1 hypothetical protein NVV90_09450 [Arthrobacter sp. CJ23]